MNVKQQLATAQLKILDRVVDREERVARLYTSYEKRFPDYADFWESLAKEEYGHANILRKMEEYISGGNALWNLGRLTDELLAAEEQMMTEFEQREIDMQGALKIAMRIENSLIDSRFYDTVNCDFPEFKKTADSLRRAEGLHLERLKELVLKFSSGS